MNRTASPANWRYIELRYLANLVGGGTPSRRNKAFFQGNYPWLTGADFEEEKISRFSDAREYLTDSGLKRSATHLVPAQTVLVTTRVNVGKVGIAQVPLCFSQDVTGIILHNWQVTDPNYIAYFLLFNRDKLLRFNRGTIITGIRRNDLARVIIPLPTLPEQREIVKILREADRLRQLRAQVDEESEKLALALFHDIFGDFARHSSYRKVKLEKNADVVSGITKGRNLPQYKTVTVPYLRVANVQAGYLDLSEVKTIDVYPDEVQKYRLQHSDVLLTEGGDFDKLGRGSIWEHNIADCIHQNHVFRVRLNSEVILPLFFHYFLQTAYARMYFLRSAKRTTNLASINISQLRALPVPLPSLSLQQHFVGAIQQVRSLLDTQQESRLEIDNLLASLLAKAFTGELTERYREQNQAYLAQLAIERDHLLQEHSAITTDDLPIKIKKTSTLRAELSSSQLAIVRIVEQDNEYRTLQSIQAESNLPPNEIERHLELLTQIGLIKAVGVAVAPGERNRVFFTTAYRAIQEADDVREADLAVLREVQK